MHKFLITEKSTNAKTGPMMVTTSPRKTCPTVCPFKGAGCYAEGGPLRSIWSALDAGEVGQAMPNGRGTVQVKGLPELVEAISRQGGKLWRMNQAGDLPGEGDSIDREALFAIVDANADAGAKGFTYTHKPVGVTGIAAENAMMIAHANSEGFTVNVSADNLDDADRKAALNIGPVVVVLPVDQTQNTVTPQGRKVVVCPATQRDDVSCVSCGLCARQRSAIVGFPAHGASKRKADAVARG